MSRISNGDGFKKNLYFVLLLISLVIISWLYTFNQTKVHIEALRQFINWLKMPEFNYTPLNLDGLFSATLATIQIFLLGTVATKYILPKLEDKFQTILVSFALGFGLTGSIVVLLSYLKLLYLYPLLLILWLMIIIFFYFGFSEKKPHSLGLYLKECLYMGKPGPVPAKFESTWIAMAIIVTIFATIYYHAIMFPPLEFDSIIYHAPLASIIFREHGLPFIAGGGVGIGLSANYPFLFSALGSYYYLWIGSVNDLFLRIITPTMGLLSILATYCLGKEVGGKRVGIISAFLFSTVPSFLSYSSLSTQETTVTFFLAIGVLFLLKAIEGGMMRYWIVSGILFGFALLTSYQALYFIPALIVLLGYYCFRESGTAFRLKCKRALIMISSMMIMGGAPYFRNLIVLHNPLYPFFNEVFKSEFISPWMHEYTKRSLNYVASYIATGNHTSSTFDFISSALLYPSFYPLNALLVFPAILVFLFSNAKMKNVILAFALIPALVILLNKPSFIRYLWLTMPYSSVMVGLMFSQGFDACNKLQNHSFKKFAKLFLSCLIFSMVIFALPMVVSGTAYIFMAPLWPKSDAHYDYLWFTANPNIEKQKLFDKYYGSDARAWNFLTNNMGDHDRVATFETRIYYIKNSSYKAMFFLDNKEAEKLYQIHDINETISFLKQNNVKFFFERANEEEKELFSKLPLTKFLSTPQFPIVFEDGSSKVYKIGNFTTDPIVDSTALAYIAPSGWANVMEIDGHVVRSVIRNSNAPRLYVATPQLMNVTITYLDKGHGKLITNLYNPYNQIWLYDHNVIKKENSGEWRIREFLIPMDVERGFVELGLFAEGEDFVIKSIKVDYAESNNRAALNSSFYLTKDRRDSVSFVNDLDLSNISNLIPTVSYIGSWESKSFNGIPIKVGQRSQDGKKFADITIKNINMSSDTENLNLTYLDIGTNRTNIYQLTKNNEWKPVAQIYTADSKLLKNFEFTVNPTQSVNNDSVYLIVETYGSEIFINNLSFSNNSKPIPAIFYTGTWESRSFHGTPIKVGQRSQDGKKFADIMITNIDMNKDQTNLTLSYVDQGFDNLELYQLMDVSLADAFFLQKSKGGSWLNIANIFLTNSGEIKSAKLQIYPNKSIFKDRIYLILVNPNYNKFWTEGTNYGEHAIYDIVIY